MKRIWVTVLLANVLIAILGAILVGLIKTIAAFPTTVSSIIIFICMVFGALFIAAGVKASYYIWKDYRYFKKGKL